MTDFADNESVITLCSPMSNHFAAFAFGNSLHAERVCEEGSAKGQSVVICGAGPSLREHAADYCHTADQVWGCNSALPWLVEHGYKATHGFTIDQTPEMLNEWASTPDVEYLLASTVHPHLTELLVANQRPVRFFHNYVGMNEQPVEIDGQVSSYEDWMYSLLYKATVRVGSGLNAVTRAIDLAEFMGFDRITVLGADCALVVKKPRPKKATMGSPAYKAWLAKHTVMHADGGNALASGATAITLDGTIDGRHWTSKPDMLITAVFMVRMQRRLGDRLRLIGDTLPNALKDKPDEYLERLPGLAGNDGKRIHLG